MNQITIPLDWREVPAKAISKDLAARFHGPVVNSAIFILPIAVVFAFLALLNSVPGLIHPRLLLAMLVVFTGYLGFHAIYALLSARLQSAVLTAPVRQTPSEITLDAAGLTAPGAMILGQLPWSSVTDLIDIDDGLLILFSPLEYIPLMDAKLPESLSRDSLRAQIEEWRT